MVLFLSRPSEDPWNLIVSLVYGLGAHCYFGCFLDLLIVLTRGPKASIYTDLTPISISIFVSISISVCISVCTRMSRSPEAYLHTPTAYQTDLSCEAHDAGTHATHIITI